LSWHGFLPTRWNPKHDFTPKSADNGRPHDRPERGMNASLEARAAALVNPESGIANDYLNHYNEILLLIENLPVLLPEMVEDILKWKPVSYRQYFNNSPLPGSEQALLIYDSLDEKFRNDFEDMVELLDKIVVSSIEVVFEYRQHDGSIDPEAIVELCEKRSADVRVVLDRTADLVNHGYAPPLERPQHLVDQILAAHLQHKTVG
jgi:nucleotide-binding universal stress UspA family protein